MDQSVTQLDHLNDEIVGIGHLITSQEEALITATEISDDDIQIICVKKKEKPVVPAIKVESSDEEMEEEDKNDVPVSGKSPEVQTEADERGDDNRMQRDSQSPANKGCRSPKDVTCSICLGEFDNKSFLDQCFHAFCFYCILQWSEVVRTCPLCKASFSSIIHSVKSMMEYELHELPRPKQPSNQQTFHLRNSQEHAAARSSNLWEWRTRRRERRMSLHRRKQIEVKRKRKSIYANNLWVQNVTQSGRARFRDTSPQFFHDNPACIHRLVPWLTRELSCLLQDDQRNVEFLLQLIMTLIKRMEIGSEEFIQHLQPFLFEKTNQFAHEFLSFARSPYDMATYDERAQYECRQSNTNQDSTETPLVTNTSATGWDSPEEFATSNTLSPSTSTPGPSGLSGSTLIAIRSWSPPLSSQRTNERILTDVSTSGERSLHEGVSGQKSLSSPERNIVNHRHEGKGKGRSNQMDSTRSSNCITISSWESDAESHSDIVVSSDETSSPSMSQVIEEKQKQKCVLQDSKPRRCSSDEKSSPSRRQSHPDFHESSESKKIRRKHSWDKHRKSRSSSRVPRRKRSTRSRSPTHRRDSLAGTGKGKTLRPSSPTEEEIKREISELERKIAEDTKRLEELLAKQEKRRLGHSSTSTKNPCVNEDSGTDELSR